MSSIPARLRSRLRETADSLARRAADGQAADWSRPLIGAIPGQGGGPDLLAGTADAVTREEPTGWQARTPVRVPGPGARTCLLVTTQLDFGGLAEVVALLALGLPEHGVRTVVLGVTPGNAGRKQSGGQVAELLRASGVKVVETDEGGVGACIGRLAPDVISAHGAPSSVFATAKRAGVPFIDNLHGMYSVFSADWRWHREAAQDDALAAVIVVSDLLRRDYLVGNPEFPPGRVVAIPNAVTPGPRLRGNRAEVRRRLGITDEFLFVSLARHSMEKNSFGLVAAFAEMATRHPEAHLVLAGRSQDARYFGRISRLRDSLPCADRIHLRGHTTAPGELLAAADGFVLDSFHEGGPLSSMEALCAGVPVVLSEVGNAREQVGEDPARGYVVTNPLGAPLPVNWKMVAAARFRPQVNQAEYASRMGALVANRERYAAAREQLAAESRRRFSSDLCLARHARVITAAAERTPLTTAINASS